MLSVGLYLLILTHTYHISAYMHQGRFKYFVCRTCEFTGEKLLTVVTRITKWGEVSFEVK